MEVQLTCLFSLVLLVISRSTFLAGANEASGDNTAGSSLFYFQDRAYPRDCQEVHDQCSAKNTSGVHLIQPDGYSEPFWVSCSDEWTVFHRRMDGSLEFNRTWSEYQNGFGFLNTEHWLGNEKLSYLTNQEDYELTIDIETENGDIYNISFQRFRISDAFGGYKLISIGEPSNNTLNRLLLSDVFRTYFQEYYKEQESESGLLDCDDLRTADNTQSQNYIINPTGWTGGDFTINCDMETDGGKWTVIQRRESNGVNNFHKPWEEYKTGFGDPSHEFWIGNEMLSFMTNQKYYEIRFDMVNRDGNSYYAKYDFFRVCGETDNYRLNGLGTFTGTAVYDAIRSPTYSPSSRNLVGRQFSTYDRDNDAYVNNCASSYKGGWWYNHCHTCDMNGERGGVGFWWYNLPGDDYLRSSEMKIRPRSRPVGTTC